MDRLASRMVTRVLEGKYRWGYLDEAPLGRGVWVRQRLTVYPPGTNCAERRLLTFHRDWPLVGAITALFVMIGLSSITRPLVGAGVAAVLYLGVLLLVAHATSALRARCRTIVVVSIAVNGTLELHGNAALQDWAKDILERLSVTDAKGLLTALQYEAIWSSVYRALDEGASRPAR
jgi:hypothetical protein